MAYSKEDCNALMSSEIFREYFNSEIQKEASLESKETSQEVDKGEVLRRFKELEDRINGSPRMKVAFQALQNKFITDPEYTKKVDPLFVEGVLLLNLL